MFEFYIGGLIDSTLVTCGAGYKRLIATYNFVNLDVLFEVSSLKTNAAYLSQTSNRPPWYAALYGTLNGQIIADVGVGAGMCVALKESAERSGQDALTA